MNENKLENTIARAKRAELLKKDDILNEAFRELENQYIAAWRGSGVRDTDARERLWQALQLVGKVRDHLDHVISDGTMAKHKLNEIMRAA